MNLRPFDPEPNALPNCATSRLLPRLSAGAGCQLLISAKKIQEAYGCKYSWNTIGIQWEIQLGYGGQEDYAAPAGKIARQTKLFYQHNFTSCYYLSRQLSFYQISTTGNSSVIVILAVPLHLKDTTSRICFHQVFYFLTFDVINC